MKPYGEKPKAGEYYDWFDKIDVRQPELDDNAPKISAHSVHPTEGSRADTLRPNVKIEFGVNEIRATGGGKKSRTFNDGTSGKPDPGVGETGEDCFNFSPTHDSPGMKIKIQVHHPHFIKSAKLEVFCRRYKAPIWTRCWGKRWSPTIKDDTTRKIEEIILPDKNDGTYDFEIDWSEIQLPKDLIIPGGCKKPDFADGVMVVPRSPYQLRFSVSARASREDSRKQDKYGFPQIAWTFAHVLVKEINLGWGKDEMIPKKRADFKYQGVQREEIQTKKGNLVKLRLNHDQEIANFKERDRKLILGKEETIAQISNEKLKETQRQEIKQLKSKTDEDYEKEFSVILEREKKAIEVDEKKLTAIEIDKETVKTVDTRNNELWERQKDLLATITKNALSPGQGDLKGKLIEVNLNVPKFNEIKSVNEFFYFQEMWGRGPLIPIVLNAKIKNIAGDAVEDPQGLGRAQFIWDWQDNENEDLDAQLDKWLTISSGITKSFIKNVFDKNRDKVKFPFHGFNCPAKYGGRRGTKRPTTETGNAFVFPASLPDFPEFPALVTHEMKKRDWTAVSYADPAAVLKDKDDNPAATAVLFHSSAVAGDRFRISVCLAAEELSGLDKDIESDAYYDLIKDAKKNQLPWATTYYFEVWRHINASWFHTPAFNDRNDQIVDYVEKQMEREIGFKMKIEKQPFPDIRNYYSGHIGDIIREKQTPDFPRDKMDGAANLPGIAILLRACTKAPTDSNDYPFNSVTDIKLISDLYKNGTWLLIDGVAGAAGREIKGKKSGNSAFVAINPFPIGGTTYPCLMVEGDNLLADEDFDCGESAVLSQIKGKIVSVTKPVVVIWATKGFQIKLKSRLLMSSRIVNVSAPGITSLDLDYSEGKVVTRQLSNARIDDLKQFAPSLKNCPADSAVEITITGHGDSRGKERMGYVKTWLEENVIDAAQIMFSDLDKIFQDKVRPASLKGKNPATWSNDELNEVLESYQSTEVKWRKVFNKVFKEVALPNYSKWSKEGRALFVFLRGRNRFDNDYTNGAIESDWSTDRFGMAGVFQPALTKQERSEKRWLKSIEVISAHEFGHLFVLPHSPARVFDSKEAKGEWADHLAHDACLMNYDPDTAALCGWCMLRKRGWHVSKLVNDGGFTANDQNWIKECKTQMEADAAKGPANKVRFAMFLLDMNYYLGITDSRVEEARTQMAAARSQVPADKDDEKHIFLLRCETIFYLKIDELVTGNSKFEELKRCSDFNLDIGEWKYNIAEKRLVTAGETGQHWKMQQADTKVGPWFKNRKKNS